MDIMDVMDYKLDAHTISSLVSALLITDHLSNNCYFATLGIALGIGHYKEIDPAGNV